MKTLSVLLFVIAAALGAARAQTIEMRLSVKVILHPTTGVRPTGITDARIREAVTNANLWMTRYSRGYRFRLDEILDIGGPTQGGINGPSLFYMQPSSWFTNIDFQTYVNADPRFQLRPNQVNLLAATPFTATSGGGGCPLIKNDGTDESRITCRMYFGIDPFTLCHEMGHFFGLNHTFGGCECPECTNPSGDGDGLADTLREASCFTQDQIALENYLTSYGNLTAPLRQLVDNTYGNTMGYGAESREQGILTVLQLDRLADIANTTRRPFVTGRTLFLSPSGLDGINLGFASSAPRRTFANSTNLTSGAGTDIMLLRPGNYAETLTFRRPVTFRTPMNGSANLGKP